MRCNISLGRAEDAENDVCSARVVGLHPARSVLMCLFAYIARVFCCKRQTPHQQICGAIQLGGLCHVMLKRRLVQFLVVGTDAR